MQGLLKEEGDTGLVEAATVSGERGVKALLAQNKGRGDGEALVERDSLPPEGDGRGVQGGRVME